MKAKVILYHGTAWSGTALQGSIASAWWCCRSVGGHEVLHGELTDLSFAFLFLFCLSFYFNPQIMFYFQYPLPSHMQAVSKWLCGAELLQGYTTTSSHSQKKKKKRAGCCLSTSLCRYKGQKELLLVFFINAGEAEIGSSSVLKIRKGDTQMDAELLGSSHRACWA